MEIVQDTNVFVAALRIQEGASAEVFDRCLDLADQAVMGAALLAEYEDLVPRESLWRDGVATLAEREALLDDSRHKALLGVARATGTSVQRLFDNFVTHVLAERQAEARFAARQSRGNPERGRKILAEIRQRIAARK